MNEYHVRLKKPHLHQEAILRSTAKRKIIRAGRRAGNHRSGDHCRGVVPQGPASPLCRSHNRAAEPVLEGGEDVSG